MTRKTLSSSARSAQASSSVDHGSQRRHRLARRAGLGLAAMLAVGAAFAGCGVNAPYDGDDGQPGGAPSTGGKKSGDPDVKPSMGGGGAGGEGGAMGGAAGSPGTGGAILCDGFGGEGGQPGSLEDQEACAWFSELGPRCAPSEVDAANVQVTPKPACLQFTPILPGVFEYSVAAPPKAKYPNYKGCDSEGSACTGRVEYEWSIAGTQDQMILTIAPIMKECDHAHVMLESDTAGDGLRPWKTISWKRDDVQVKINLQATATGYKIGSVRAVDNNMLDADTFTEPSGAPFESEFLQALADHLKSVEWSCTR